MSHPIPRPTEAPAAGLRSFYVHVSDGPSASGLAIAGAADALEAVLLFAERWAPAPDEGPMLRVHVVDEDRGERCCFSIDLGSGDVGPC
jgi:hypothetical protein